MKHGDTGLPALLEKHGEVFNGELGSMKNITVKLNIKPDSKPKLMKARPVPYAIRPKVEADLDALVNNKVLEPVTVSEWATPIVPVLKKDGGIRICGDFKVTLNPVLLVEQYPLPHIEDLFASLAGGQKFSKIDLCQAYLQMHVDEKSKELLTIVTHKGLFRYCRLPFGITSAPALFQRAMDQILSGVPGVLCYLDDILVTGKDEEEHLRNLDATLQRLRDYGLRVRKDKCAFFQSSIEYLGHVIDAQGLHKAPSKVKAILDAPVPQNVSQLRSFLGLLNYYGRFVPSLATKLKPLHQLLCRGKTWKWTEQCDEALVKTKEALLKSEALTHFDPALPIQLACDASPYGVGAVVSHIMPNGEEKPIAFASRTLNKAECNYAQIEREALSIVFGVRKFHQYLYGRKFTLLTDHRPLTSIFGPYTGIPSLAASRMQRWALLLSAHTYEIEYRKSEQHCNADGLSRLPLPVTKPESREVDIFYFRQVENAPVTTKQVRRATRHDSVLSEVMDIIVKGPFEDRMFLVMVDAHSKWPEVAIMKSTTAGKTIEKLGEVFNRFGSPLQLVSDNGPQLVSQEMTTFLQVNGVQHIRNTPHATTKASPASLLMKRELRTSFDLLRPPTTKEIVQRQQERQVERRGFKAKDRSLTRARLSWLETT
ncbi:hypothetical protein DPEC_G00302250 [Dallia pectoralis]|uniref:Uncharacterized protein n=1 Tax=Dallia pectoralis TaxID=75939 RepID=A0ACC2FH53_DALPE|nr:hypothetical protein DPEC_G00302250 [Dallia pectoralis]